jgi:hypothetical protein
MILLYNLILFIVLSLLTIIKHQFEKKKIEKIVLLYIDLHVPHRHSAGHNFSKINIIYLRMYSIGIK